MAMGNEDDMNLLATDMSMGLYECEETVRSRLITQYLPLVKRIVHRMAAHLPSHVDVDDLMNSGIIGLIQSIDRYDPSRDNTLATYASFRIRGAVLSELRSRDVLSRGNRRKVREMQKTWVQMEKKLGRDAEDWEVARELGITADEMDALQRLAGISFVRLDDMDDSPGCEKEILLSHLLSGDEQDALMRTRASEIRSALAKSIDELKDREKMVISLYYVDELTLKEIGEIMNLTESRISQIHSSVIVRLRKKLIQKGILEP